MAATKGNEFWKLRTKHGRDKIFATPEIIYEAAREYKNKKQKIEPYLISELCKYIGVNQTYFNQTKDNFILEIIGNIRKEFSEHNINLYKKGLISSNLVARQLKGKSKIEVEINEINYKIKGKIKNCNLNYLLPETGYIYFLKSKCNNYYKIGFSTNPKRRLRDICQSLPFYVEILVIKKDMFALSLEKELHKKYKKNTIKNEWYSFNDKEEKEIYNYLIKLK